MKEKEDLKTKTNRREFITLIGLNAALLAVLVGATECSKDNLSHLTPEQMSLVRWGR